MCRIWGKISFATEVKNVKLYILSFCCRVDDNWLNWTFKLY